MKTKIVTLLLAATVATVAHASAPVLPDSCGDPGITFDAKTDIAIAPLAPPAEGKAQVVLIMTVVKKGGHGAFVPGIRNFTTRFGMDGSWLGAAGNNSYFSVDVTPGEHHLCANVQNTLSGAKDMIGMQTFTAEAGKVYYFEFVATRISTVTENSSDNYYSSTFTAVDADEGKFRTKALQISTSTARKPKE
jgi:hypothetical protein